MNTNTTDRNGKLLILHHTFKKGPRRLLSILIKNNQLQTVQAESESILGNIYIAKVKNINHSVNACFVEIQPGELCFLPLVDALNPSSSYVLNRLPDGRLLQEDEILVQVSREAMNGKQPTVTSKISFSSKYLVLSAGQKHLGTSGKLSDAKKKEILDYLQMEGLINDNKICNTPDIDDLTCGYIVRTNAGELQDLSLLKEEWKLLETQWTQLVKAAPTRTCYSCLYHELPSYIKNLRDLYNHSYDEIITDNTEIFETIKEYIQREHIIEEERIRLYEDDKLSLSSLYGIPSKLDEALGNRVWLKSGGFLVIEPTEALTSIDVNSGKYTVKRLDIQTPFQVNKEAAYEIAHQIKLRNLSGIIIIDFINMKKQEELEIVKLMKTLLNKDSIPTEVIDITPLGLMEITRKKINRPLKDQLLSY